MQDLSSQNTFLELNNSLLIPQIGFGTSRILPNAHCEEVVRNAIKLGYRHIDTAHYYRNEKGVGAAVRSCGIPRDKIFLTSKIWPCEFGEGVTEKAVEKMLERFGLEYVDLLLLHWPFGKYLEAWKDMEKCLEKGYVKSIGVSNFYEEELNELMKIAKIVPAVNQLECHPCRNQIEYKKILDKYGIKLVCYEPLAKFDKSVTANPEILSLTKKYSKSVSQIILKWHLQMDHIVIPRSQNIIHMRDNLCLKDFSLTKEEVEKINNIKQQDHWKPATGTFEEWKENSLKPIVDEE